MSPTIEWNYEELCRVMEQKVCSQKCKLGCLGSPAMQPHAVFEHWQHTVRKRKTREHNTKVMTTLRSCWKRSTITSVNDFAYRISGVEVCQAAFQLYECLSVGSFYRVRRYVIDGLETPPGGMQKLLKAQGLKPNGSDLKVYGQDNFSAIGMWFRAQIQNGIADKMPVSRLVNCGIKYLLPYYNKKDAFQQFLADMTINRLRGNTNKYSATTFHRHWRQSHPNIYPSKGAGKSLFAACDSCCLYKATMQNAVSEADVLTIHTARMKHLLRQKLERMFYAVRRTRSAQPGASTLSMIIDAIDHKKAEVIKKKGRQAKSTDTAVLSQAMQSVLVHGRGVWNFVSQPHINAGGGGVNYTIECLQRVLDSLQAEHPDTPLPRTLYLQLDNCSGSNKNKYMLAYASSLVEMGVFDEVVLSFLMVGHTHEDVDQLFSVISKAVKSRDVVTPEDYEAAVVGALQQAGHTNVHFEFLDYQHNYKEWFLPHIDTHLKYFAKPHVFCFVRDKDNVVRMRYKHWHRCFTWYPLRNVDGRLEHLPGTEDTQNVDAEDNNHDSTSLGQENEAFTEVDNVMFAEECPPQDNAPMSADKENEPSNAGGGHLARSMSVNLGQTVADAVAGSLSSSAHSVDRILGGSYYLKSSNTQREQDSFRKSPGLVVTASPVEPGAAPPRSPYAVDKSKCPYGTGRTSNLFSRVEKWEQKVNRLLDSGIIAVSHNQRTQWKEWFQIFRKIAGGDKTADSSTSWTWRWALPVQQGARPHNMGGVASNSRPHASVGFNGSTELGGADDSDHGGDVIRHEGNKVTNKELVIARQNRLAQVKEPLTKGSYIICGKSIKDDEFKDMKGYSEKERKMPINVSRVEEDYAAEDDDITVTYFRQSQGNVNFKFAPFLNDKRQQLSGVLHRSSILVTFGKLTTSGALPLAIKKMLATYGDTARGKSTGLKLPFVIAKQGKKSVLSHVPHADGDWEIKGLDEYKELQRQQLAALEAAGKKTLEVRANEAHERRKRQTENNRRGETSDTSTESEEYEGSSTDNSGTRCTGGPSGAPALQRVLEQVYTEEVCAIVKRRGKARR